ncbi:sugar ABC transporter permease [Cellulomonas cellasea]|uniref:Xylose transport system permease protein XylH n=2 Tax=Cellulomonas cellasea TaxID=43670 RepID=A0A0A0B6G6_9CELL|nr:sugar ABC transporter permease [Cellulomonas cellasea]KGM01777.1 ABC transporter permease [Cellulomonas cellasea DSM 20118]GEA86175.1 ABC transporter permease [Cellulomonas cellasea]
MSVLGGERRDATAPVPTATGPGGALRELVGHVRSGELGMLPIVAALAVIWLVFQLLNPSFLSSDNLVNLTLQCAATGVLALGVVLVLLVGQIDLSVGSVSGLAAAVVAVGAVQLRWPIALTALAALAVGVVVGLLYGVLFTRLRLPSFVFTLAGLLVFAGLQLRVLGPTGSVNLPFESWLVQVSQRGFLPAGVSYALVVLVVVGHAASLLVGRARRERAELPVPSLTVVAARVGVLALVLGGAVAYLNTNRGVGFTFALFVGLVAVVDLLLRRTRWGRAVRAVGGDVESARRAGLPVQRTFVSAFVACSTLAALGGILSAGRLAAANQGTGGGDIYLTAIAAAVIGGTSLFGGRGSAWSALLGILVIQSISSGLTLLNLDTSVRYVITGVVLALAVLIDSVVRRANQA